MHYGLHVAHELPRTGQTGYILREYMTPELTGGARFAGQVTSDGEFSAEDFSGYIVNSRQATVDPLSDLGQRMLALVAEYVAARQTAARR